MCSFSVYVYRYTLVFKPDFLWRNAALQISKRRKEDLQNSTVTLSNL